MSHREDHRDGPLSTLTHARVRAIQGDLRTARSILTCILEQNPGHPEAKQLQEQISHRDAPSPADDLRPREKTVKRLKGWLHRIRENSGGARA